MRASTLLAALGCLWTLPACATDVRHESARVSPTQKAAERIRDLRTRFPGFCSSTTDVALPRTVRVEVPAREDEQVSVSDDASGVAVRFLRVGASNLTSSSSDGYVLYGPDALLHVAGDGVEDYVVFEHRPAGEEVAYEVDVSRVAGIRFVSRTVEFLDATGTPRLRMAPPFLLDRRGRHEASVSLDGCAYDASPAPPWGRAVTSPRASRCRVRIAWNGIEYPAILDPKWSATGSMPNAHQKHLAVLLDTGRVMLAGGEIVNAANPTTATAELYDEGTGTFSATGAMGKARVGHAATKLASGKVLITGGDNSNGTEVSAELYDPVAGTFAATGAMGSARSYHTSTRLVSGKVLVTGDGNAEIYDPNLATFAPTSAMNQPRKRHTATVLLSGKVLVAAGDQASPSTAEVFDPASGGFSATGPMAQQRAEHTATLLASGKVLVVGGTGGGPEQTAELYDPAPSTFTPTGSLSVSARFGHSAVLLDSGRVVLVGGSNGTIQNPPGVDIYDPVKGTFSPYGRMSIGRLSATATLLGAHGKILVAGGSTGGSVPEVVATAEVLTVIPTGKPCSASVECESELCVDGVCCASACLGQCEACDVKGTLGTCTPIAGTPHGGRLKCQGAGTLCGGTCDGTNRNVCAFPTQLACGTSCSSKNRFSASTCDGQGTCLAGDSHACDGNLVCADATTCKTSCTTNADCIEGFGCDGSKCVVDAFCVDDVTSQGLGVPAKSCVPYKCDNREGGGTCRLSCESVDDCAPPNACDPTGHCELPSDSTSGCNTSGGTGGDSLLCVLLGMALASLRRRQRNVKRERGASTIR